MNINLVKKVYIEAIVIALIVLFSHTAYNKLFIELTATQSVLKHYPLIGSSPVFFSWTIPICEVVVILLLLIPKLKVFGIAASVLLLFSFTIYIIYMLSVTTELPCTCGGMIRNLTWTQHIVFNVICILFAISALILSAPHLRMHGARVKVKY